MKKRFWLCAVLCLFCLNSMAASLYAGVPCLDNGGGFISFSPKIDSVAWGGMALVFAIPALYFWWRDRPGLPRFSRSLTFPTSYLSALVVLSLLVLLLGFAGFIEPYHRFHLPLWVYVTLLALLYLVLGYLGGRRAGTLKLCDLLWSAAITTALGLIGLTLLSWASASDIQFGTSSFSEGTFPMDVQTMMGNSWLGGVLGRVNLPACVLLDAYAYYIPQKLWDDRTLLTELVCLVPPVLYTLGWLGGCATHKKFIT